MRAGEDMGLSNPSSVLEVLARAASGAYQEADRWLSADEIADALYLTAQSVRPELLRLQAEDKIQSKIFARGLTQRVPRFRIKDVSSGVKGGDALDTTADAVVLSKSPQDDPPHKKKHHSGKRGPYRQYNKGEVKKSV